MRQVVKDRIARIDVNIAECQQLFAIKYKQENDPVSGHLFNKNLGTRAIERKIQELVDQKEEILAKAIFGSLKKSKYDRGLEDRQNNLNFALDEQRAITEQLTTALSNNEFEEAKHYRVKLGNCNRIVSIYQKSLDTWLKKQDTVVADRERVRTTVKEAQEIREIEQPVDTEILKYINDRSKDIPLPSRGISNTSSLELITRPEDMDKVVRTTFELDALGRPKMDGGGWGDASAPIGLPPQVTKITI